MTFSVSIFILILISKSNDEELEIFQLLFGEHLELFIIAFGNPKLQTKVKNRLYFISMDIANEALFYCILFKAKKVLKLILRITIYFYF